MIVALSARLRTTCRRLDVALRSGCEPERLPTQTGAAQLRTPPHRVHLGVLQQDDAVGS